MRLFGYKLTWLAQVGLVIVAINIFVALFAPWIAPFDQATPVGDPWADPDWHHWLGLGRHVDRARGDGGRPLHAGDPPRARPRAQPHRFRRIL